MDTHIVGLKTTPLVLTRKEALCYSSRISPHINLNTHRDICLRKATAMLPLDLTGKYAVDIGCGEGRWSRLKILKNF